MNLDEFKFYKKTKNLPRQLPEMSIAALPLRQLILLYRRGAVAAAYFSLASRHVAAAVQFLESFLLFLSKKPVILDIIIL